MNELTREELEQKILQLQDRLAALEGEAEQKAGDVEGLGHFAGSIAHDLNNLLVGILGNAGLALMDLSAFSPCRPLIQEVEIAAQRAAELTNRMLEFTGAAPPAAEVPASPAAPVDVMAWRGSGLMLVVDDEPTVRGLARRVLEKFGFRVMTAEDGLRALEIFRPHSAEIACVLLDVTMPNLDGAETFREMRQLRPEVKVILSSGYDQREAMRKIDTAELAGFLHKPYLPMELVERVREALEG